MKAFGADAQWLDGNSIQVRPKPYQACRYTIESDWSAASYWYEMMALVPSAMACEVSLLGLEENSMQGDSVVKDIFRQLGVDTSFSASTATEMGKALLRRGGPCVKRLDYDFPAAQTWRKRWWFVVVSWELLSVSRDCKP